MKKILTCFSGVLRVFVGIVILAGGGIGAYFAGMALLLCSNYYLSINKMDLGNVPPFGIMDGLFMVAAGLVAAAIANGTGAISGVMVAKGFGRGPGVSGLIKEATESWLMLIVHIGILIAVLTAETTTALFFFWMGHHVVVAFVVGVLSLLAFFTLLTMSFNLPEKTEEKSIAQNISDAKPN